MEAHRKPDMGNTYVNSDDFNDFDDLYDFDDFDDYGSTSGEKVIKVIPWDRSNDFI
jgi:Fe-S-cluster formation regulator IscX/YfhJ